MDPDVDPSAITLADLDRLESRHEGLFLVRQDDCLDGIAFLVLESIEHEMWLVETSDYPTLSQRAYMCGKVPNDLVLIDWAADALGQTVSMFTARADLGPIVINVRGGQAR